MGRSMAIVTAVTTIALVSATVYAATQLSLNAHKYLSGRLTPIPAHLDRKFHELARKVQLTGSL